MGGDLSEEERIWRERIARLTDRIGAFCEDWTAADGEPHYVPNQ